MNDFEQWFHEWYNEPEGLNLRGERIQATKAELEVAFNAGAKQAERQLQESRQTKEQG